MKNKKPKILSLFSGAGGLDLGFKNAGFDIGSLMLRIIGDQSQSFV